MKSLIKNIPFVAFIAILLTACNKDVEQFPDIVQNDGFGTGKGIADVIAATPDDSLFNIVLGKSGMAAQLNNLALRFTVYVPNNTAVKNAVAVLTNGAIPANAPNANVAAFLKSSQFPAAQATALVQYHTTAQLFPTSSIPATFPNLPLPSVFNPAPALSALLRLDTYPSSLNGKWLNNIPMTGPNDVKAGNGYIHHLAAVAMPPSTYVWDRIATDPNLTYFKAAIQRADSGVAAAQTLQAALGNIGANFTVFAPTDAAFQTTLYALAYPSVYNMVYAVAYQQAVAASLPPATAANIATAAATANAPGQTTALVSSPTVFSNPALYPVLTAQTVKGVVVYHMFGNWTETPAGRRAFTNNFPVTSTAYHTLLNSAVASHPGVWLTASFGATGVTGATVKGAANATPANITINPFPNGSSDQNYLNGVLHKIDQVLLPQSF